MPDFTHGDKPMPSGWKPPGYDYRSQQQGNDMAASDRIPELPADSINEPTSTHPSPSKGLVKATTDAANPPEAIEDKLREILWDFHYDIDEKNPNENLESLSNAVDKLQAIITTETTKAAAEATGLTEADRYDKLTDTQRKWLVRYHKMCLAALQEEQL